MGTVCWPTVGCLSATVSVNSLLADSCCYYMYYISEAEVSVGLKKVLVKCSQYTFMTLNIFNNVPSELKLK